LAGANVQAADLAEGFLRGLANGQQAHFDDDRMYVHRLGNLIEAYLDWSGEIPDGAPNTIDQPYLGSTYLPSARLLVRADGESKTIVSAARGGVFKHFAPKQRPLTDAGLIVEMADDRIAVSQSHDLTRLVSFTEHVEDDDSPKLRGTTTSSLTVSGPLHWVQFETATPLKQSVFHLGMWFVGRWCRTLVRRLLQGRLITGRKACPVKLTRTFEFGEGTMSQLRVVDQIELLDRRIQVRRMSFASDLQAAYVAASDVYQESILQSWTDLQPYVAELNTRRVVTMVRKWH
jgi:hypothetical protein